MAVFNCPVCGSSDHTILYESRNTPTQINFLYGSREEALACPRGDIVLGACGECDTIVNTTFDPEKLEYREGYENALHHSTVFQSYADSLAERLVTEFNLREKSIIEVGCGDGTFLRLLCERGNNRGIGFDPSAPEPGAEDKKTTRVEIVRDYFSEAYSHLDVDFLYSRHTLEHIPDPMTLLLQLRRTLDRRAGIPVFFEVPNGLYTFENLFIWDIIYEHTTYFTPGSLRFVFERAGFNVSRTYEAYSGQFLCIEGSVGGRHGSASDQPTGGSAQTPIQPVIKTFAANYKEYVDRWRETLKDLSSSNKRVIVWGGGSKGITFLNLFGTAGSIDYVVDINPKKHGKFIAGTGQEIVPPERVREIKPDTIIVVNPVYKEEIEGNIETMGISTEYLVL